MYDRVYYVGCGIDVDPFMITNFQIMSLITILENEYGKADKILLNDYAEIGDIKNILEVIDNNFENIKSLRVSWSSSKESKRGSRFLSIIRIEDVFSVDYTMSYKY